MKKLDAELVVGCLMLLSAGCLVYLSLRLGQLDVFAAPGYTVFADFTTAGGLQTGAAVELAGVRVGQVNHVGLSDYEARITMTLQSQLVLHSDARATIKTNGLIGERYVELVPGTAVGRIPSGGEIQNTESPVDIQQLIGDFIFGNVGQGNGTAAGEEHHTESSDPLSLD